MHPSIHPPMRPGIIRALGLHAAGQAHSHHSYSSYIISLIAWPLQRHVLSCIGSAGACIGTAAAIVSSHRIPLPLDGLPLIIAITTPTHSYKHWWSGLGLGDKVVLAGDEAGNGATQLLRPLLTITITITITISMPLPLHDEDPLTLTLSTPTSALPTTLTSTPSTTTRYCRHIYTRPH